MATLNPALKDFWRTPARNRVLYGGRASSKSWDAGGMAVAMSQYTKLRILCTRQFQNRIDESVYSLLKLQIERFGLTEKFTIGKSKITCNTTGSEFLFYGLWRHIDEIKSLESIDICWVEEAHSLTEDQWDILEPTIRKEGSQFWFIFNPKLASDFVYRRFVVDPPPNTIVRKINYDENPFLSDTMREIIEAAKAEDYETYKHVYLGEPRTDDSKVIIKRSWVEAAVNADLGDLSYLPMSGMDVADGGEDKNAISIRRGPYVHHIEEWDSDTTTVATRRALLIIKEHGCLEMAFDAIGVGAGVKGEARELEQNHEGFRSYPINVSNSPTDTKYDDGLTGKELFRDLKMELWWRVRERFRKTYEHFNHIRRHPAEEMISIPDDEQLVSELTTPYLIRNETTGKMHVESKKDMRERGVKSPNKADAVILSFAKTPSGPGDYDGLLSSRI